MLIPIVAILACIFTVITVISFIALLVKGLSGKNDEMQGLWGVFFAGAIVSFLLWYFYFSFARIYGI